MKYIYLILSILFITNCSQAKKKDISIIFRYDDPSIYSNLKVEKKVLTLFQEQNLSLTFAVIPYRCAGEPADLKPQNTVALNQTRANIYQKYISSGTLEVAQHGYSHQTHSSTEWSEFAYMPYKEQVSKVQKGKTLLETLLHTSITSFVPPYNTYDTHTLKTLEALGFLTISADLRGIQPKTSTLVFLSNTITLNQIHETIQKVRNENNAHPFIVVMFHEYNFSKQVFKGIEKPEMTMSQLSQLLSSLKKQKDIHILSLQQAYNKIRTLDE